MLSFSDPINLLLPFIRPSTLYHDQCHQSLLALTIFYTTPNLHKVQETTLKNGVANADVRMLIPIWTPTAATCCTRPRLPAPIWCCALACCAAATHVCHYYFTCCVPAACYACACTPVACFACCVLHDTNAATMHAAARHAATLAHGGPPTATTHAAARCACCCACSWRPPVPASLPARTQGPPAPRDRLCLRSLFTPANYHTCNMKHLLQHTFENQ
jgi:hypothetical protein